MDTKIKNQPSTSMAKVPNTLTQQAMQEVNEIFANGQFRFKTGEEMFNALDKTVSE